MSWKSIKKIGSAVVNPVGSSIEKLTGISQGQQLGIGAGVGGLFAAGKAGQLGSVLPSIIGAVGDIYSARQTAEGQGSANEMNIATAREQMAFQERMSSTAHQREVADLRAAGLNPALSANSGASTPVGASADISNAAPDYSGIATRAIGSALQVRQMQKDFQEADSRIGANRGAARKSNADASMVETAIPMERKKSQILNDLWDGFVNDFRNSAKSLKKKKRNNNPLGGEPEKSKWSIDRR